MLTLFLVAAAQASGATPPPVVSVKGTPVYVDEAHDILVNFVELPTGNVYFASQLPAGWAFDVSIDGDQNGSWGFGPGKVPPPVKTSPDRTFGQDSRNGVFCSQYVFTSAESDPKQIYSSSECGELKSNGHVNMSGFDGNMRAVVSYEIPSNEFFGSAATARIQVCVWEGTRRTCQHMLPNLLELKRAFPTAAPPKP